ncbi:hypothetical protein FB451DRAFT_1568588 [Mycena latifolia]|nr:hypothetical protein FB451DRAFT_1568588 [Mycena latifolia]
MIILASPRSDTSLAPASCGTDIQCGAGLSRAHPALRGRMHLRALDSSSSPRYHYASPANSFDGTFASQNTPAVEHNLAHSSHVDATAAQKFPIVAGVLITQQCRAIVSRLVLVFSGWSGAPRASATSGSADIQGCIADTRAAYRRQQGSSSSLHLRSLSDAVTLAPLPSGESNALIGGALSQRQLRSRGPILRGADPCSHPQHHIASLTNSLDRYLLFKPSSV